MRRLRLLVLLNFALLGCARTYRVSNPEVLERGPARFAIDEVRANALERREVEVSLRSGARAGTSLRQASLARPAIAPCQARSSFSRIDADGVEQTEGPLELGGSHRLHLVFVDPAGNLSRGPLALDLELGPGDSACARLPLFGTAGAPSYRLDDTSAGALLSVGGRGLFPVTNTSHDGIGALALVVMRLGAAFGPNRLWGEFAGGTSTAHGYSDIVLAFGGDHTLWQSGLVSFALGGAYEGVFELYRAPGAKSSAQRYFLHGPRVTPSLTLSLVSSAQFHDLPAGRRTLALELEAPTALWFGADGAPEGTLAPGVGLSVFGAL
jgi:hypothetical protein